MVLHARFSGRGCRFHFLRLCVNSHTTRTRNFHSHTLRDYPIIGAVKPFLESLPKESEWCFPKGKRCKSKNTEVIGHSEIGRRVDKYLAKAGLPHMKAHGFCHSCVSYLLSKGMSYRTVARWVGDIEQVVLQTYSHLLPDEKDEIAKFIDSIGEE